MADDAFKTSTGNGGETHQQASGTAPVLTTNHGVPISDNQNSLRSGTRGPTLLEDFVLREKIFHFDHERIPERIVHARGSVAHGTFEVTKAIPELTRAALFQKAGNSCDVFARFSTVAGERGAAEGLHVTQPRDARDRELLRRPLGRGADALGELGALRAELAARNAWLANRPAWEVEVDLPEAAAAAES